MAVVTLCSNASSLAGLQSITRVSNCSLTGGVNRIFVGSFDDVDWTATHSGANWNSTTETLSNLVFLSGKGAAEIQLDGESSTFTSELNEQGLYENSLIGYLEGISCERDLAIRSLRDRCDLFAIAEGSCWKRLFGVEDNGTGFQQTKKSVKLTSHTQTGGTETGDKPNDLITLTSRSKYTAICADGMSNITTI